MVKINDKKKFNDFYFETSKKRKIDLVVIHHIEAQSIDDAIMLLKNHQVSSHYIINEKGKIYRLVEDKNIAYHAGFSYWKGKSGLNKNSIGIEIINKNPFNSRFKRVQMRSLIKLCSELKLKYKLSKEKFIGHSDIAYYPKNSFDSRGIRLDKYLDRKQDPSHLFNWEMLSQKEIGVFPDIKFRGRDSILFKYNDSCAEISEIKKSLKDLGYKVTNISNDFNNEMKMLVRVFNRHFNPRKYKVNSDLWWKSSDFYLKQIKIN